jgi:phosphonate transport system substrate-binding protein
MSSFFSMAGSFRHLFHRVLQTLVIGFCLLPFVFTGLGSTASAESETSSLPTAVTIGFIPGENPDTMRENMLEFAKLLQGKIGIPVNVYVSKDYSGLIEAMKEKKIDFGFFSAMTFVFAEKNAGAKVLLKKVWASPFYHSLLMVRADSHINSVQQLKQKKMAFVDEKSASGYLYPRVFFKKENIDPAHFFSETIFTGNHKTSVEMLLAKKVDAIAIYSNDKSGHESAWTQFAGAADRPGPARVRTKILWVSDMIPTDPFCVRKDFYEKYPKISHDLMFDMIELQEDATSGAKFRKLLGVTSLVLATSQQYEPVRNLVRELDLKLP